ncbi:MAG: hypothetical protein K8T26_19125 [Lentisphaerae bacterium]|nr:hypothetical protein [Lentisphaerota bacterium]
MKRAGGTNLGRRRAGAFGLMCVLAWMLIPTLHRLHVERQHPAHPHSDANCAVCVAGHQAAPANLVALPRLGMTAVAAALPAPVLATVVCAPDVRAISPRGPPSHS